MLNSKPIQFTIVLLFVFGLQSSFFLMGGFSKSAHAPLLNDSWILHSMAKNYLADGVLRYQDEQATLTQLPLYPWLIAQVYKCFGEDARMVLWLQMLLSSLSISGFVVWARKFLGPWSWLLAGFLGLDIHLILYSSCLLTEFWVCLFWMLAWVLWVEAHERSSYFLAAMGVAFLALAAYTKPLAVYLPVFVAVAVMLGFGRQGWLKRIGLALLSLLLYGVLLLPLLWRNESISSEFPRYTTISSFNVWFYNLPYFEAHRSGKTIQQVRYEQIETMRTVLNDRGANLDPISMSVANDRNLHRKALGLDEFSYAALADELTKQYFSDRGLSGLGAYLQRHLVASPKLFIVSNLSWIKLVFHRFDAVSFGWNPEVWWQLLSDSQKKGSFLFKFRVYELLLVSIAGLLSLMAAIWTLAWGRQSWLHLLLFAMVLYVPLVAGVNVWGRFRFLVMPLLWFAAVDVLKRFCEYRSSKRPVV